jgi:hypothetical protein
MQQLGKQTGRLADWVKALLARRHSSVVACASANKLARTAWALAARNSEFTVEPRTKAAGFQSATKLEYTFLVLRPLTIL